jgi:hypothetical protein
MSQATANFRASAYAGEDQPRESQDHRGDDPESEHDEEPPGLPSDGELAATPPQVHVLYLRPTEHEFVALDQHIARLTIRFAGLVDVSVIDGDDLPPSLSHYGGRRTPTLLVLRDGRLIGEAVGTLPLRELVGLLTCAVSWPREASADQ